MQVNQMKPTGYHVRDRILSFFIALIMLISSMSVPEFFAFAEDADNSGGFVLTMSWNSDDTNDNKVNPDTAYLYDSKQDEERIVTLKVKYQNKDVSRYDYEAGSIIITIPGLKGAVRSEESYIPVGVAADAMSNPNKTHDWSYSYTQTTDTFTFINNKKIDAKSTFEGSFEIMWKLPSRKTIDDCNLELTGKLNAVVSHGEDVENYEAVSNSITYEQKRERDKYTLTEEAEWLYKDEPIDLNNATKFEDYTWVKYTIRGTDTYFARDVEGSERFDCYFLADADVQGAGLQDTGDIEEIDGITYKRWSVTKNITSVDSTFLEGIFVTYPPNYKDLEVTNYVKLYGTYFDENKEELLAEIEVSTDLSKYHFQDIPGDTYDVNKHSYGVKNSYIENHCPDLCQKYGAINASHLSGNRQEYKSSLNLDLNFKDKEKNIDEDGNVTEIPLDLDYYDLEFVDDIMDISVKEAGEDGSNFRQLSDDEYHFTRIIIPSNEKIRNSNNLPIKADTYGVEIYFRRANGEFPYKFLTDDIIPEPDMETIITSSKQELEIPYNDVVGVKIVVRGVKESFYTNDIYCCYQFDISDEEISKIDTNGGQLVNNMYFNLYRKGSESDEYEWCNAYFTEKEYSDKREYDRDIELYENPLDREKAALHILEIPSEFKIKGVKLEQTQTTQYMAAYNGSITSEFILGEGADYSKFSMYMILPNDLQLFDNCTTEEALKEVLTFSSEDGLSSAYISEHTTIEIDTNYNGTGRQYLAFHFAFDEPTTSKTITVSGIPIYINKDNIEEASKSYTMYAGMLIDQSGNWYSTSKDDYAIDDGIWKDMDGDGNTEEPASFGNTNIEVVNPRSDKVELVKFVKTTKTVGYVNLGEDEEVPMTYAGGTYSYRLRASVGEDNSVKNFIFFDAIETHNDQQWQGEFVDIDYSYAEKIFGVAPTIYYSTEVETFSMDKSGKNYDITLDALTKGNWTKTKPANDKIRSVAVYFGEAVAESKSVIYIDIIMKAPDATVAMDYYGKVTVNNCAIGYDKVNDATEDHENLPSNAVRVKFVPYMGKITLTKKDAVNGQTITAEAKFELYRKGDTSDELIGMYTTQNGRIIVRDLLYGDYYFKEVDAPKGYERSEEILEVELNDDEPEASVIVDFTNERKSGEVKFKKVSDRDESRGLQGAEFAVYDSKNNLVYEKQTTGANGELIVRDLAWGSYYLKETKAPDGYELSDEITEFVINAENDAGRDLDFVIKNEQKPAYATLIKHEIIEDGVTKNDEINLAGAVYELHKADGTLLGTYMTNKDGKIYAEDLTFGEYYFKETIAPKGYELDDSNIEFEVNAEHTFKALEVPAYDKRKLGRASFLKLDDEEQPVKGAVYGLFNAETDEQIDVTGKPSTKTYTTTEEGYIELNGLWWGKYYLKELKAPTGYQLNDDKIEFTVDENTVSKRILCNTVDPRLKGEVMFVKSDESNKQLEGAVYTLYRNDGSIYKDNLTTDADGTISVKDIPWGSYYFLEKNPPAGYGLSSEKIRFSVNYLTAGKIQELSAIEPTQITYQLTVVKKIKISDIVFSHGNPTFTFKVVGDQGNTYHQAVTFSEEYLKEYQTKHPDDEYIEASVIFADLVQDKYTVTEIETNRYETDKVEAENGTVNGKAAEFDIDSTDKDYQAVFTNKKTTQDGLSHTSQISNILKRSRKYTALVAEWTGSDAITTNQLDRDSLNVWAIYDDGTQIQLEKDAYTLDPKEFDSSMNGDYTVKVSYTDSGITRSDSFAVEIDVAAPFTWMLKSQEPFTEGETKYDGTAIITGYLGNSSVLNIPKSVTGWVELTNNSTGEYTEHSDYAGKKYKVVDVGGVSGMSPIYGIKDKCDTLILPDGLITIGDYAFYQCTKLTGDLIIPDSVETIGTAAFGSGTAMNNSLVMGFNGRLVLGKNLVTIGNHAFSYCSNLTGDLTIPDGVKQIGNYAFNTCKNLDGKLTIPDGVTSIGSYAFRGCNKLTGDLIIPNSVKSIGERAFMSCSKLTGDLIIPDGITSIGSYTFYGCSGLNGMLKIPDSVTSIGIYAFQNCSGLNGTLTIPDRVTSIGNMAFQNCRGFTASLNIGNSVKTIGNCAFQNCSGFTGSLTIPDSVTSIGESAFQNCSGFTGSLTIGNGVTSIGNYAFDGCTGFTDSLTIGNQVNTIGDYAFRNCKFTGNLVIPDGVTKIGTRAFNSCDGFTDELIIPGSVTEIGDAAFMACSKITKLTLNEGGLTTIGSEAFSTCGSLGGEIRIPSTVTSIGRQVFGINNYSTISIIAPKSIEHAEDTNAFYYNGAYYTPKYHPVTYY